MLTDEEVAELRWRIRHPVERVCERPIHVLLRGGPLDGVAIGESEAGWREGSCGFGKLTAQGVVMAYYRGRGPVRYFVGYHLVQYG